MVLVDRALWIGLKCSLTAPAHLLVESAQCGHVACRIRGLPLRSWRRNSHRRGPWPVGWKDRKAQQKVARLIWPRCPCIPAIDRRQFFGGGQLRKLRNINAHLRESGCRVRLCGARWTAGRREGAISATRHPSESRQQRNILAMQCVSRLVPMCFYTGSNSYRA